MQPVDLVIAGGRLVFPDRVVEGGVAIERGRIVSVGSDAALPRARLRIDAAGKWIIPGALDVHVHFREPGFSHKETWTTATRAAARGGVTTVFDMPNTNPPTATAEAVREKIAIAKASSLIDFGVYGVVREDNLDQLRPMAEAGAVAFKLYMGSENPLVPCPSDGAILEAFEIIRDLGMRCTVHAENTPILEWRGRKLRAAGRTDAAAHLEQHADVAAVEGTQRALLFSEWTGCPIHIAHENCRFDLPLIAAAKARGVDVTVEACPHNLLLSTADGERVGPNTLRVKPPVREPGHAEPLFEAFVSGLIDILSTDHAPHLAAEKRRPSIWDCAPGFPGVETSMRLILTEVHKGRLSISDFVRAACEAPARAFGLHPRKGVLAPGADGDVVVIDPDRRAVITASELSGIDPVTPFEGRETVGMPVLTVCGGRIVMKDGRIATDEGGLNIRR